MDKHSFPNGKRLVRDTLNPDDNLHYEKFSDGTVKCIEDEIPFDVPDNWEWVRLGAICPYGDNKAIPSDSINESSWILDLEDIEKDTGLIKHYTTKTERNSVSNKYAFTTGQLLYSKLRPYLNKVVIATKDGYCTTEIFPLIFYGNISAKYMQIFMMSPTFLAYANMISYGVKMPRLGTSDGKNALITIPPINEQLRIRKQFDIIIPLLRKIEKHSDTLHSNILATKSKILDLAIRGKLVQQDPNDEPASVLLERIRAEKEELIKQGKIKRNKKESVIFKGSDNSYYRLTADNKSNIIDIPFDIPDNWVWCNLSMIGSTNIGLTYKPTDIVTNGTMVLRSSNIINGKIDLTDLVRVNSTIRENQYIQENDILICARNGSKALVGKCAIYENANEKASFGAFMAVYRSRFFRYVYYFLNSEFFRNTFSNDDSKQINQLTQDMIKNTTIPLPPFAEQKRIVDEIEKIFATLDDIATQVA